MEWEGYVYVLSNPSIPDLWKIGFTTTTPEQRAKEVSDATGVPTPYRVEAAFKSRDPRRDERKIHEQLADFRTSPSREFFGGTFYSVLETCRAVTGFRVERLSAEAHLPNYDPWEKVRTGLSRARVINAATARIEAGSYYCPGCTKPMGVPKQSARSRGGHRYCARCLLLVDKLGNQLDLNRVIA
jgi:hypothetical protein